MKKLSIEAHSSKAQVFENVAKYLREQGYIISTQDLNRPWGGFFVLDESQIIKFKTDFFKEVDLTQLQLSLKLSPKFLIVAPGARLSWQYHHRRAELWKLISGKSAISRSQSDNQGPVEDMVLGEVVSLAKGERHRLLGTESWGIVAEIWIHTDPGNQSDENDIVRLQDDYARK